MPVVIDADAFPWVAELCCDISLSRPQLVTIINDRVRSLFSDIPEPRDLSDTDLLSIFEEVTQLPPLFIPEPPPTSFHELCDYLDNFLPQAVRFGQ